MTLPEDVEPPPTSRGLDADLLETYWKPFKYTPSEDAALCFSCREWRPPHQFAVDANGYPAPDCTGCASAS